MAKYTIFSHLNIELQVVLKSDGHVKLRKSFVDTQKLLYLKRESFF